MQKEQRKSAFACLTTLILATLITAGPAYGADHPPLTLEGKIEKPADGGKRLTLNFDEISKLPVTKFRTQTQWTPESEFTGVRISDLLDRAKASPDATEVVTRTLDSYEVSIPIELVRKYPVILAYAINGKRLTVANKGPYWVTFPTDDYPELKSNKTNERSAWSLKGLIVK